MTTIGNPYLVNLIFDDTGQWTGLTLARHQKTITLSEQWSGEDQPGPLGPVVPLFVSEEGPVSADARRFGFHPASGQEVTQPLAAGRRRWEVFQDNRYPDDLTDRCRGRVVIHYTLSTPTTWAITLTSGVTGVDQETGAIRLHLGKTTTLTWFSQAGINVIADQPGRATVRCQLPAGPSRLEVWLESQPQFTLAGPMVIALPTQSREAAVVVSAIDHPASAGGASPYPLLFDVEPPAVSAAEFTQASASLPTLMAQIQAVEMEMARASQATESTSRLVMPGATTNHRANQEALARRHEELVTQMTDRQQSLFTYGSWERRWARLARLAANIPTDNPPPTIVFLSPYPPDMLRYVPGNVRCLFFLWQEARQKEWEEAIRQRPGVEVAYYRDLETLGRLAWARLGAGGEPAFFAIPDDPRFYPAGLLDARRRGRVLLPRGRASDRVNLDTILDRLNETRSGEEAVLVETDGTFSPLIGALYAEWRQAALYAHTPPAADPVMAQLSEMERKNQHEKLARAAADAYRYIGEHKQTFLQTPNVDPRLKQMAAGITVIELPRAVPTPFNPEQFAQSLITYATAKEQQVSTDFRYDDTAWEADREEAIRRVTATISPFLRERLATTQRLTVFGRGMPYHLVDGWGNKGIGHVIFDPAMVVLNEVLASGRTDPPIGFVGVVNPGLLPAGDFPAGSWDSTTLSLTLGPTESGPAPVRFYATHLPLRALIFHTTGTPDTLILRENRNLLRAIPVDELTYDLDLNQPALVCIYNALGWLALGGGWTDTGALGYLGPVWTIDDRVASAEAKQLIQTALAGQRPVAVALAGSPATTPRSRGAWLWLGTANAAFRPAAMPAASALRATLDTLKTAIASQANAGAVAAARQLHHQRRQLWTAWLELDTSGIQPLLYRLDEMDTLAHLARHGDETAAKSVGTLSQEAEKWLKDRISDPAEAALWQSWLDERLGSLYQVPGSDVENAIAYMQNGIKAAEENGDTLTLARRRFDLGVALAETHHPNEAVMTLETARRDFIALNDYAGQAETLYQIAAIHREGQDWLQAEAYLLQASHLFQRLHDPLEWLVSERDLAQVSVELNKGEAAGHHLANALRQGWVLGSAYTLMLLGDTLDLAKAMIDKGQQPALRQAVTDWQKMLAETTPAGETTRSLFGHLFRVLELTVTEGGTEAEIIARDEERQRLAREVDTATGLGLEDWVHSVTTRRE